MGKNNGLDDVSVQFLTNKLPPFTDNAKANGIYFNHNADTTGYDYHIHLNDEAEKELKFYKAKVLANVTIKAKSKSPIEEMDKRYTSGLFSGGDAREFDLLNDRFAATSLNIFQYLQGKVAGLQISVSPMGDASLSYRGGTPQLFLDETPVDATVLSSLTGN